MVSRWVAKRNLLLLSRNLGGKEGDLVKRNVSIVFGERFSLLYYIIVFLGKREVVLKTSSFSAGSGGRFEADPCPGGSPAGEELAIVTFYPGVCEKE